MSIFVDLSVVALRQVACAVGHSAGESAFNYLVDRFTNHGEKLNQALQKANDRAWQTLENSLAGPSILNYVLQRADDRIIAERMRQFLESCQFKADRDPNFCKKCLAELRTARRQGILNGGATPPSELAQKASDLARLSERQKVLDAEWRLVEGVASALAKTEHKNLAKLLTFRPSADSSILVCSVRYFFRLEVETDQQLFQGLAFAKLEDISERQEKMLGAMTTLLTQHSQRFDEVVDKVLNDMGKIKVAVEEIRELQRRVLELLEKKDQMQVREIRPGDSFSIRNDSERQMVKMLVDQYRSWPDEQRRAFPELLNEVGKLQVVTGDFQGAQRDFREAAGLTDDVKMKAEAQFNAYHAALEQKKWDEALAALKEAVGLDAPRFAPFSFADNEPLRILGAGGFGVVFLCKHPYLKTLRVVKSVRIADLDRTINEVFIEAQTLEALHHPAIIRLLDCNYADVARARPYLVMDYFEGSNLESFVESQGTLSYADLLKVARPIAEALEAAHARGILHRDVKPANILVRRDGDSVHVKLIDFGLAIQPDSIDDKASTQGPQEQTMASKSIAGTVHYSAPEQMGQLPGVAIGPHSDVYGFGKTCYYALFKTHDPDDVEKDAIPEGWRNFLRKCTAQKLANRMPNFKTVLAGLRELEGENVSPPPPPPPPRGTRPRR